MASISYVFFCTSQTVVCIKSSDSSTFARFSTYSDFSGSFTVLAFLGVTLMRVHHLASLAALSMMITGNAMTKTSSHSLKLRGMMPKADVKNGTYRMWRHGQ
jgi:hypothetical protein